MIKVWLTQMQTDMTPWSKWQTKLNFTAIIDEHDVLLREQSYTALKLGKPMVLVNEDVLATAKEVESLKAQLEIAIAERDKALARVVELKAVSKSLLDRF